MSLILVSGKVIPPPSRTDVTTLEGLRSPIHLFEPKHSLFPSLAHALGTLADSFASAIAAVGNRFLALGIGLCFLVGAAVNVSLLAALLWFNFTDLAAYLPMAWLGYELVPAAWQ